MRAVALALLALTLGCSDGISPDEIAGPYRLVAITANGADVALTGSLVITGSTYTMEATFQAPRPPLNRSGTYSVQRSGVDLLVTFQPAGFVALYSNGHIIHDEAGGLEMRWLRQ